MPSTCSKEAWLGKNFNLELPASRTAKKLSSCSFESPSLWHCYDSPRKLIQKVYEKNKKKHATELRIKDYFLQHTNSFSTSKRK